MNLTEEMVMNVLRGVKDPELGRDVVSLNMIHDLQVDEENRVRLTLQLTTPACPVKGEFQENVRKAILAAGAREAVVHLSANTRGFQPFPMASQEEFIRGVKNSVAIASGKGGVGKSSVTVNLAVALALDGAVTGILDGDIYGPTIPLMMNLKEPPMISNGKIHPTLQFGCKVMSMGLLLPKGEAVVWRGPMIAKMIREFLVSVDWGELDYLLIDLPPGTGDASLTLAQTIPLSGAVIVTTPQEAATSIATKAVSMFGKLNVPILGILENMSYYECPSCGRREEIFGQGGGEMTSRANEVPLLGKIPLDPLIRKSGDEGKPITVSSPASTAARAFQEAARKMAGRISVLQAGLPVATPLIH